MRLFRAGLALAVLLVLVGPASAASAADPTLVAGATSPFGRSTFLLTLPERGPLPADAILTENGGPLGDVSVIPAAALPGSYGVVLVLDTSAGRAARTVRAEYRAARALIASRPAGIPMAIITYDGVATVAVPFTTDQHPLVDALRAPPIPAPGARVVDAADAAVGLFAAEKLGAGAIVLVAGERDRGSRARAPAVARRAREAGIWIFGIGLRGPRSATGVIDALTPDGVGQNLGTVSRGELVPLLRAVGEQTAGASVLSYTSAGAPGSRVTVEYRAGSRSVRTDAVLPEASRSRREAGDLPSRSQPASPSFAETAAGRVLISLAVIVLLVGASAPLLASARRRRELYGRVGGYGLHEPQAEPVEEDVVAPAPERSRLGGDRMRRLGQALEIAGIDLAAPHLVLRTVVGAAVFGGLVAATSGIPLAGIMAAAGVPLVVRYVVRRALARQRGLFADQLADALQAAASAMRGGHSFVGALASIADEAPEPTAGEFRRVVAAERVGVPLADALGEMTERMDNRDVRQVALVALLQRETGGSAAEAVDRVVENLRGRDDVRRLVTTLTSQGRMSRWVLTAIPVGLGLFLTVLNGEYMAPLFETGIGRVALLLAVLMCAAGSTIIGKIVDIEV